MSAPRRVDLLAVPREGAGQAGRAEPLPVVLLHSSGSSARQWRSAAEALRAHGVREVHAVEVHGHGEQAPWRGARALALDDEVALVEPLLRRLGRAHLVGHSYGGAVAIAAALRCPARAASVTAYEPVLFSLLREDGARSAGALQLVQDAVHAMRADLAAGRTLAVAQRFVVLWSGRPAWERLDDERRAAVAQRMPAVLGQFEALFDAPIGRADLERLRMPLLLLSGARTVPVARRIAALLREALPMARHETPAAMGHMGPITHAEAFNRRLVAFVAAAPLAASHFPFTLQGVPA